jgi:2-polyprenyl-3-methyl-5-hydroxy-6-metoxy-1,4-benzoquinol methylase
MTTIDRPTPHTATTEKRDAFVPCSRRIAVAAAFRMKRTARTSARAKLVSTARCSSTNSAGSGSRLSLKCTPGCKPTLPRVADVRCGAGWSSIGIAGSYPKVVVDGFDLDAPSIELARANAAEAGVTDRVRFQVRDAGDLDVAGRYDLVNALECIHDMSHPVAPLSAMRRPAKADGAVVVVDERVADAFMADGGDVEWMMYGWSVLHCLPVRMAEQPSAATGTAMRSWTLRRYALQAGFGETDVLPIENFVLRFYRLPPT